MASIRDKLAQKKSKLSIPKRMIDEHPADTKTHSDGSFFYVDTEIIKPNPHQPRKHFDEKSLGELCNSIKQSGVIQPVIIRKDDDNNTIFLVAGERRLRAAKMAGLMQIPAILTKGNPAEIALIENLQRENLNPIEESEALSKMIDKFNYTQQDLSRVIGKGRSTIAESISLNRLPDEIKKECRRADFLSKRVLVEVSKQKTDEEMIALYQTIKDGNLKSDDVRKITRKGKTKTKKSTIDIALYKILDLKKALTKLDVEELQKENSNLIGDLIGLREYIDNILEKTNKS